MRLTTDKPNGMYELAHNGCYIDENRSARYRDFETDIDARELTRDIMRSLGLWEIDDDEMLSDEIFDEAIMENLMYGTKELEGLIALFYRNLWAMAELRERLKHYEDLEEQGLLLKLPCKVGDTVWCIYRRWTKCKEHNQEFDKCSCIECGGFDCSSKTEKYISEQKAYSLDWIVTNLNRYGETWFLSKEEAEKKLAEMKVK